MIALHLNMVARYHAGQAHARDILSFKRKAEIWAVEVESNPALLYAVTYLEKRSGDICLRYRPTKAQQDLILSNALRVQVLCSVEWLEAENKRSPKENRGDIVERLAAKAWGGVRPANRATKFTEYGDFEANGVQYQVKYGASTGAATITTESTLNNLGL